MCGTKVILKYFAAVSPLEIANLQEIDKCPKNEIDLLPD